MRTNRRRTLIGSWARVTGRRHPLAERFESVNPVARYASLLEYIDKFPM